MSLRCLIFSSSEEVVQPIRQVLADLGIEGEHCVSAVDAVERVTTQLFQIVITDWDDQPEAAFLLKTARDLKAAHRPLTLAIVSDDGGLPEVLKAGANSVLIKPIRAEQVRDTMSTACQLLRAKQPTTQSQRVMEQPEGLATTPVTTTKAAAASAGTVSLTASVAPSVAKPPEKIFRAGEFLQPPSSVPGAQFDTEVDAAESIKQAIADVDALTELEPTAAAVEAVPAQEPEPDPEEPLTGWAAVQARLSRTAPVPAEEAPAKSELLSYGETPSSGATAEAPGSTREYPPKTELAGESAPEAALFAYMPGKSAENAGLAEEPRSKRGRFFLLGLVAACLVLVAVPRARQKSRAVLQSAVHAGKNWLNPPPAPVPQAVPQHDSFGQSGDEYKLPVVGTIPDATTDPSQIRVLPVVDPTAKPVKGSEANVEQAQPAPSDTASDPNQSGQSSESSQGGSVQTDQSGGSPPSDQAATSTTNVPKSAGNALPDAALSTAPVKLGAPEVQTVAPPRLTTPRIPIVSPSRPVSSATSTGIPSSLKSQMASTTPEASGNKPPEAAMSSIEPVTLPESVALGLLAEPVAPVYPDAAKTTGQRGSVVLQVLIGRDGAVQDAKFLQGSLVFARAAIDAVKQWRFKPYSMNGRAVSVQSVITLSFKPPA